jgi:transcriptional regulator with XRE-family HTH domain
MNSAARDHLAIAFGAVLKEARTAVHYTQEHLAVLAGLDHTYPSLLERGQRHPSLAVVCGLAEALSIPAAMLVSRTLARLQG